MILQDNIKLYHASYIAVEKIDLTLCSEGKDFGKGFYVTTNYLHPFREGNGRTQRIFISKLIKLCGYEFNFSNINPDLLMIATIKATNGVTDDLYTIFQNEIR